MASGLYPALLAVKAEIRTLPKDAINPHFKSKYTPLDTIVEHVEPILTKHGLVWVTKPGRDSNGDPALAYRLIHAESGASEDGEMALLLNKTDPQGQGSAITYARRYALCAVLNLVADADDDGEATRAAARGEDAKPKGKPKPKAEPKADAKWQPSDEEIKNLRTLYGFSGWHKDSQWPEDEHHALRLQLAAVGAGNAGPIGPLLAALTQEQFGTVRDALAEAAKDSGAKR